MSLSLCLLRGERGAYVVLPVLLNAAINFTDVMASTTNNSRHLQVRERERESGHTVPANEF